MKTMQLFRYDKLFRVRFLHYYYRSKATGDLECLPSEECKILFNNFGLKFKPEKDGFTVFGASDGNGFLVKPISKPCKFTFTIRLSNPSFVNFSDLPLVAEPKQKYYFNNLLVNKVTPPELTEQLLLNQGGQVSADDLIKVQPAFFPVTVTAAGETGTALLKGIENDHVFRQQTAANNGGKFSFNFELAGLRSGRYKAEALGVEQGRIYFPPKESNGNHFGYLEVFSDVPADHRFTSISGEILYKEYAVLCMNRKTFWRYKVNNPDNKVLADPEIKEASHPWNFDHLGGLEFVSQDSIPLAEESIKNIVFRADKADPNSILVPHLPNPSVGLIKPDAVDPTTIFSDIHIYI